MRFDFAFDQRVAKQYDAQRAHPGQVSEKIGAAIASEAGPGARVLEIGIGTGRIAWPVAMAGCEVIGFDISPDMLQGVFGEKRPSSPTRLAILQADMHHLPFPNNAFEAALAVHVLHLAREWHQVVQEIARVLRPGAALIQGEDWIDPQSVVGQLRDQLRLRAIEYSPNLRPPAAGVSKEEMLQQLGATQVTEQVAAEWTMWISPAERLAAIEQRMDNESWMLPDRVFDVLFQQLQTYAAETWPDLEAKQAVKRHFILKITRGNWR